MGKRSNLIMGIGVIVFVIGVAVVALILRNTDDGDDGEAAASQAQQVVVVQETIPAGTSGDEVVANGWASVDDVDPEQRAPDAITSLTQLPGRVFSVEVAADQQVRDAQLRAENLRADAITIPEGMQALAVDVPFVPGVAGYVGAGDFVNVYGVYGAGIDGAPRVQQLLSNVEVLDVSVEVAPRVASQDQTNERSQRGVITYLLAVDGNAAEKTIFTTEFGSIYLTLPSEDLPPTPTPGRTFADVLS